MATATPTPKPDKPDAEPNPLYALVGATNLAVEGVRHAFSDAVRHPSDVQDQLEHLPSDLARRGSELRHLMSEPKKLQTEINQLPGRLLTRAKDAAQRAEDRYEEFSVRGQSVVERMRGQKSTQELIDRGKATISRTKAAATTARQAAEDVATSARERLTAGKRGAATVAEATTESAQAAKEAAEATKEAATGTATTARRRAVRPRSARSAAAEKPGD